MSITAFLSYMSGYDTWVSLGGADQPDPHLLKFCSLRGITVILQSGFLPDRLLFLSFKSFKATLMPFCQRYTCCCWSRGGFQQEKKAFLLNKVLVWSMLLCGTRDDAVHCGLLFCQLQIYNHSCRILVFMGLNSIFHQSC